MREELRERPLADEADAGAVLLLGDRQAGFAGDVADFGLQQIAEREQHVAQVVGVDGVQEVALVLGGVAGLEQLRLASRRRGRRQAFRTRA